MFRVGAHVASSSSPHPSLVQKTNVYALQVVVGTDIKVAESTGGDKVQLVNLLTQYKPNVHIECHDRILGGQIGVSTTKNEVRPCIHAG